MLSKASFNSPQVLQITLSSSGIKKIALTMISILQIFWGWLDEMRCSWTLIMIMLNPGKYISSWLPSQLLDRDLKMTGLKQSRVSHNQQISRGNNACQVWSTSQTTSIPQGSQSCVTIFENWLRKMFPIFEALNIHLIKLHKTGNYKCSNPEVL